MRIVLCFLAATLICVAYWIGFQRGAAGVERGVIAPSATEVFNLRSRCAELCEKILKDNPASPVIDPSAFSHYDQRANRCYVELDNQYSLRLFDGQTGERLAELWNGPIPTAFLKGIQDVSREATRGFIESHMKDDRR
jgi:hypothetical protein